MTAPPIRRQIAGRTARHEAIARRVAARPGLLPEIVDGLKADEVRVRYGCLKVLRLVSETRPAAIYGAFDVFAGLLDSDDAILRWGAILIVGNLAAADADGRIDGLLDRYLRPLSGPALIAAANTIGGAAKIALARPHLANRIVGALLKVETAKYQTPECRNVALGHVLKSLDSIFALIRHRRPVLAFARRQLRNRRNAVRLKARAFLGKHAIPPPSSD